MSLIAKQDEWSNLLFTDSIERPPLSKDIYEPLSTKDKLDLAAAWVSDGIHARHTDYPRSTLEIQYFKYSRSALLRGLFNLSVTLQISATFLDNTSCDHDYSTVDTAMFHKNGVPTRLALTIADLCFLGIYLFDLFLVFAVNPSKKSFTSKPWSTFRLFICLFVFMDCLLYFIDPSQPRLMRCVFPFLLISRRNNLKLMLQGLLVSAYNSLPIIKALVSILLLWGFAGFFFFRATDGNEAFNNPGGSIAQALHCFTSRPYVLKAVDTIYANNQASTVYFITLTLAADILCIALIVAVGAKHYKQFAGNILHQRLVDRRHAITCAFRAVASCCTLKTDTTQVDEHSQEGLNKQEKSDKIPDNQTNGVEKQGNLYLDNEELQVSKEDWIIMCSHMGGKYAPTPHTAAFIFDLVVDGDPREHIDASGEVYKKFVHHLDEYLFFRCCALVATRIVIQVEAAVTTESESEPENDNTRASNSNRSGASGDGVELSNRLSALDNSAATTTGENIGFTLPIDKNVMTVFSPSISANAGNTTKRNSETEPDQGDYNNPQGRTNPSGAGSKNTAQDRLNSLQNPSNYHVAMLAVDADVGPKERRSSLRVLRVSERRPSQRHGHTLSLFGRPSRQHAGTSYLEAQFHTVLDVLFYYLQPVRDVCVQITGANVTVGGGSDGAGKKYMINLFYAVNIFLLLLLLLDLCFLSQPERVAPWFRFACVLETFFWCHLFVRIIAVGVRRFVSFYENRGDTLLNIFSLIAIVKLGTEYYSRTYDFHNSLSMGWYLLFQCGRLFKLFFAVNDVKIFEHMRPVLIRASFIYFSIIYFFAIFGYSYFCNALNVEDAANTSAGNDASQWVQYSNLLNFNTLLQSLFTLFEVSILGNWSIVMDAAVASTTQPASAYIFFYTYRLLITLFILPILLSFIIQVFLSALSAREREMQEEAAAEKRQNEENRKRAYSDGEVGPVSTTRFSLGAIGIFSSNPFVPTLAVPGVSKKVSYNVNQEVLVLGRQGHTQDEDGDDGERNDDNAQGERDTEESETLSPLASELPFHSTHGTGAPGSAGRSGSSTPPRSDRSGSPTPGTQSHKMWRPHFSVKLDVDKQAATNARDKYSESIPNVSNKAAGSGSGGVVRGSDLSSVQSAQSVDHRSTDGFSLASLNSMHRGANMVSTDSGSVRSAGTAGGAAGNPRVGPTAHHPVGKDQAKVTVQYDSKAGSSMMSIWTIGDNQPQPVSGKSASNKSYSSQGPPATHSPLRLRSPEQDEAAAQVSQLQAQLQAALRALDAERAKNKSLTEHSTNLM